jgi:hypothetical protein
MQGLKHMLSTAIDWKIKRDKLKATRQPLFDRYEKNPHDLHLALEIKTIDDQIAECTNHMAQERGRRN